MIQGKSGLETQMQVPKKSVWIARKPGTEARMFM